MALLPLYDMTERTQLLRRYYARKEGDIFDLRRLKGARALTRRVEDLKRRVLATKERTAANATYRRLWLNMQLAFAKRALCGYGAQPPPAHPWIVLKRLQLELSEATKERETEEARAAAKADHTLPLLDVVFFNRTDEQLRALVATLEGQ